MGKVFCAVCRKRCKGDILKVEQQFVHHKCFQCTKCRKNLQQGGFFVRDQKFYCPEDYQSDFGIKCEVCHTYVEGEVVSVLGKTFHIHCFRCCICRRLFTSGERTTILDGAYHCASCAHRASNGMLTTHPVGDSSPKQSPSHRFQAHKSHHTSPAALSSWAQPSDVNDPRRQLIGSPTNGSPDHFPEGQLTVQINENGYLEADKRLVEDSSNHLGEHGDPHALDTILSTTPGQTYSGESFTFSGCERRICPPGVDYGRHYPVSYLELAERGLTAIMCSEDVPLQSDNEDRIRSRSLMRPAYQTPVTSQHLSRRDELKHATTPGLRSPQRTDGTFNSQRNDTPGPQRMKANTFASTVQSSYSIIGSRTPAPLSGRPRRDLYVRRRELSPGSASLGSNVVGFHAPSGRSEVFTLPPGSSVPGRASSRSTPNVRGKKGMTMLAESLVQPRPRADRSLSPDSAAESWAEARRLASYPNARIPDSTSLPAIERFDFPAPPSPAVVMIEKRREKRLSDKRSAANTLNGGLIPTNGAYSDYTLTDYETTELPSHVSAKLRQIDSEIETLKRLGESSGITTALIQELEALKLVHAKGPDLDPVSASRSPSANTEPGYRTRYDRHVFASPSRDTRRDRRAVHTLSSRMDYSSTGGRSCTIPSFQSTPRPGYTSGVLYGRAVSLPRPALVNGYAPSTGQPINAHEPLSRLRSSTYTSVQPGGCANMRPSGHLVYGGSGDHTLNTDESLGAFDSQTIGPIVAGSMATSALSMDGLTGCSGDDITTLVPPGSAYIFKSGTMTGLPHTVTGLRPVSALLKQQSNRHRSRTHTPMRRTYDSDMNDVDGYPSVQSWLRSSTAREHSSFKSYPYEKLRLSAGLHPKGIDRTKLENYIDSSEFESMFKMTPSAFRRLPEWKQNDLKRKLDLM